MKKEAPTTPRGKNSNETLSDRPVPSSSFHTLYAHVPAHVYLRLTLHVVTLVSRYQSSSQDSAASSLTADKTPHRQDRNPTPERLQPKANTSTNRRKRLVRQFSLWVHVACDYCWRAELQVGNCTLEINTPQSTWSKSNVISRSLKRTFLFRTICRFRKWSSL